VAIIPNFLYHGIFLKRKGVPFSSAIQNTNWKNTPKRYTISTMEFEFHPYPNFVIPSETLRKGMSIAALT
jgi:hypothetical protein